jgi:hypothetical protein
VPFPASVRPSTSRAVIPEGAGSVNPVLLLLIFLLAVHRLPVGVSG